MIRCAKAQLFKRLFQRSLDYFSQRCSKDFLDLGSILGKKEWQLFRKDPHSLGGTLSVRWEECDLGEKVDEVPAKDTFLGWRAWGKAQRQLSKDFTVTIYNNYSVHF